MLSSLQALPSTSMYPQEALQETQITRADTISETISETIPLTESPVAQVMDRGSPSSNSVSFSLIEQASQEVSSKHSTQPSTPLRRSYSTNALSDIDTPIDYTPIILRSSKTQTLMHGRLWQASNTAHLAHGVVTIIHGMGEHSGCYKELAKELNGRGYHVLGFDHRGHGMSQGRQGVIAHYNDLHHDVEDHISFSKALYPSLPHVVYAHSMGGGLMLDHLHQHGHKEHLNNIQKFIISAPWIRLRAMVPPLVQIVGWLMQQFDRNFTVDLSNKIPDNPERDPIQDPMCHQHISPNWFMGARSAGNRSLKNAQTLPEHIQGKLVLFHSDDDQITCPSSTKTYAEKTNATFVPMRDFGHSPHITRRRGDYFGILTRYLPSIHTNATNAETQDTREDVNHGQQASVNQD